MVAQRASRACETFSVGEGADRRVTIAPRRTDGRRGARRTDAGLSRPWAARPAPTAPPRRPRAGRRRRRRPRPLPRPPGRLERRVNLTGGAHAADARVAVLVAPVLAVAALLERGSSSTSGAGTARPGWCWPCCARDLRGDPARAAPAALGVPARGGAGGGAAGRGGPPRPSRRLRRAPRRRRSRCGPCACPRRARAPGGAGRAGGRPGAPPRREDEHFRAEPSPAPGVHAAPSARRCFTTNMTVKHAGPRSRRRMCHVKLDGETRKG